MTEDHDETQEQVRRLLGAAASPDDARLPDEVASRLDDVLAGLVAERAGAAAEGAASPTPEAGTTAVTELAARRRRRWPQLLVAAAAVSVIGLGVGNLAQSGDGEAQFSADQETAGQAEELDAGAAGAASQAAPEADMRSRRPDGGAADNSTVPGPGDRPRLRTATLALDVQRIEDFGLATPVDDASRQWEDACVRPRTSSGDAWLPVRLDGEAAVLVLRAPTAGRRTGDVFACGAPEAPVASVTVDAR